VESSWRVPDSWIKKNKRVTLQRIEMLTLTRGLVLAVVFCAVAAPTEARLASGLVDHDKIKRSSSPLPQRDW